MNYNMPLPNPEPFHIPQKYFPHFVPANDTKDISNTPIMKHN